MAILFPTALFGFLEQEVDVERQTLRGGTALSGEQDVTSTDGGGRVFAEFASGALVDPAKVKAWRALLGQLEEGVTRVVVPFCDPRHQIIDRSGRVPHSDKTPFSDGSLYAGGGESYHATDGGALRAVTLRVSAAAAARLEGGEWFAVEHPNKGWRAYKVGSVGDDGLIEFRPPLREAVGAGEMLDLATPRCLMVQDGRASSRLQNRRYTDAAIRFIEAP